MARQDHGGTLSPTIFKTTRTSQFGLLQKKVELKCDAEDTLEFIPAIGDIDDEGYYFIGAITESQPAGILYVTLNYELTFTSVPATTYTEKSSAVELDIRQHPLFASTLSTYWDNERAEFKPDSPYYGITSYVVGSTSVVKTEYFADKPSAAYASIGTLSVPGGGYTGDGKWMIVGSTRGRNNGFWTVETEYVYSAKGYNTTIYS